MPNYICTTCGIQYAESEGYPVAVCTICADDRQYVKPAGQGWTTLDDLRQTHHNEIRTVEPTLTGIATVPSFTIGQRLLLVQTDNGNVLWDCNSLIDDDTVGALKALGGVDAIAVSHPHMYDSMVEWSQAFDDAPIYLHRDNEPWVMRPDKSIVYWERETHPLLPGVTLIRCGGHFPGSSVLHWSGGADGKGVLLTGDTIMVVADTRWVTFMYSYPNEIPLNKSAVEGIVAAVDPYDFERLYSAWWDKVVPVDAKNAVKRSAERYIRAIS
jgi:hypothetical protein